MGQLTELSELGKLELTCYQSWVESKPQMGFWRSFGGTGLRENKVRNVGLAAQTVTITVMQHTYYVLLE